MKKYFKSYTAAFKIQLAVLLEYRLNFLIRSCVYIFWAITGLGSIYIVFDNLGTIAGWEKEEIYIMAVVYNIANAVYKLIFHNAVGRLAAIIKDGRISTLLLKPVPSQFFISTNNFGFEQLPRIILFIPLLFYLLNTLNVSFNFTSILLALLFLLIGQLGIYSVEFIINCWAFWKPSIWNLFALYESYSSFAQYPTDIYKGFLNQIFLIIPVAIFGTIPAKILLLKEISLFEILFSGLIFPILFLILTRIIWNKGIKQYDVSSS